MVQQVFPDDYLDLSPIEQGRETNAISAAIAGLVSGAIKVPEGVVSLGAELIDAGFDTNTAEEVEKFFDKVNVFEEIADDSAVGKIVETLVQIGVPGTIGFKLASGAVKAKKAGNYANFKSKNLQKAAKQAAEFNRKVGRKRFVAGVAGGAAGEAFVADVEDIGTFGDVFGGGPTELKEVTDEGGREDAFKKLMNRTKFGSESLLITPFVYGTGKAIKAAATRGKNIEFSSSQLDKFFNTIFSSLRARGAKPQKIFEEKMIEKGATMADTNRAMELVKVIDKEVDTIFPSIKSTFDKSLPKQKESVLKELNDAMFSGSLDKSIPKDVQTKLVKTLKDSGAKQNTINNLFGSLKGAREKFVELINATSNAPKDVQTLKSLMGSRAKEYLGNTYKIFEDNSVIPFLRYKPTEEAMDQTAEVFKKFARENRKPITDFQANTMVENVVKSAQKQKTAPGLPFKYAKDTAGDTEMDKLFKNIVTDQISPTRLLAEFKGSDRKVLQKLFGKIEDPRFSVYNSMTKLSSIARKNELFERLAKQDLAIKRAVTKTTPEGSKGFFFDDQFKAAEALPNQDIVELDKYLLPFFKDEFTVNPLAGKFTSKAIAEGLGDSSKSLKFLFEARPDATLPEQFVTWGYRNLILFPKALSQVAKTILAPVTHFRNLFSATGFSAANGIFFENPLIVGRAFKDAFGKLQLPGRQGAEAANAEYRELLELGVVNSQVQLGDVKNLLRDVRMGENLNIEKPLESMMKKLTAGAGRKAKAFMKGAEDLYTAEDDLFKIANYAVERYRLKNAYTQAGINFTERQLKEEAADIVRNTVPNYAYVSDTVRALRRLPLGTFMSFPSEILRTTTNAAQRALREIKNPALRNIGLKRLLGLSTVLAVAPYGIQKGFQGIFGVSNEEVDALKQYLPDWSKNSTILPIRTDKGDLKYIDFSHGNAYDVAIRPIQTLLNEVQKGIEDEDVLMEGVLKGMAQASGELAAPFISEAIYTEAALDIIARGGRTREGRQLYTEAQVKNKPGEVIKIITNHLAQAMLPFSYQQLNRLYQAAADKPSKRGEFFELPDELLGFAGYRAIKVDPVKAMGFKIADYQRGVRESRALFTGGSESVLRGGPKTPRDVIERFVAANKAKFYTEKEMAKNILAADVLGANMDLIAKEFVDRGLKKPYGRLSEAVFKPYFPSRNIQREFQEIAENIGQDNPFESAIDVLQEMYEDFADFDLSEEFEVDINNYLPPTGFLRNLFGQALPPTPMPNISPVAQQKNPITNLTQTEEALLSPEEKVIAGRT